eukprot:XP_011677503.1 PREDICTED: uncharacterized protein LOC105444670 [Strongylocentrotus purpuratus]
MPKAKAKRGVARTKPVEPPRSPSPPPAPESQALGEQEETNVAKKPRKGLVNFSDDQEKELGEWLLANPIFYDKGCKAYRDTHKKKSVITEKCKEIGIDPAEYTTWYHSMRSGYGRLSMKSSGSGSREFTSREKWILATFSFFKTHIVRHESRQLGVSI